MHIAVLYQHYNTPDCASDGSHHTLLTHWAARHRITLITADAWQQRRLTNQFDWVPPGTEVHTLSVPYDNVMGVGQRLRAFASFAAGALVQGLRIDRPDVVLGVSTPLTTAWIASLLGRWRGVPWVFHVRDLWPDFPIQMGAIRHPLLQRMLYGLEHRLYHHAAHVVPLSPDMEAHVLRHGVDASRVTTLFNGTDFNLIDAATPDAVHALREKYGLVDKRVVLYGGTYGRASDIGTILAAAEQLRYRSDLRFVFIGDGYEAPRVQRAAELLPNVLALPPQPRHRMFAWFRMADVSLVTFINRPVLSTNSPGKFFDSLGAGTPVIVNTDGWMRRFAEAHRCGWHVAAEDPHALAQTLDRLFDAPDQLAEAGARGEAVAREQFDRQRLAAQLEAVLIRAARG